MRARKNITSNVTLAQAFEADKKSRRCAATRPPPTQRPRFLREMLRKIIRLQRRGRFGIHTICTRGPAPALRTSSARAATARAMA
jgi:hypothetical protein